MEPDTNTSPAATTSASAGTKPVRVVRAAQTAPPSPIAMGPLVNHVLQTATLPQSRHNDALEQGSLLDQPLDMPEDSTIVPPKKRRFSRTRIAGLGLLTFGLLAAVLLGVRMDINKTNAQNASLLTPSSRFQALTIPLYSLGKQLGLTNSAVSANSSVTINGSLVLAPSVRPTSPVAGQLYYNGATNQVQYYNGTSFVELQGGVITTNVYNNTTISRNTYVTNAITRSGLTGSGTTGTVALFTSTGAIGNSLLAQAGAAVTDTGTLDLQASSNSTSAFEVNSDTGSALLTADTTDDEIVLGQSGPSPTATTLTAGAGVGTNVTGANLTIEGSNGTGASNGGDIIFETGQGASGGIRFDNAAEVAPGNTDATSLTMSYTTGSDDDRLLVVDTDCAASSMTYDGFALTKLGSATAPSSIGTGTYAELWYLLSPPSGEYSITANYLSSCDNGNTGHYNEGELGASSYYNVNQANPFGTFAAASGTQNGTGTTSLTVNTISTSQIVVDAFGSDDNNYLDVCTTPSPNQNIRWYSSTQFQKIECGSDAPGTGGTITMQYAVANADWVDIGIPINPAQPGSTPLVSPSSPIPDPMSNRLEITADGNIGIDNDDPQATLDVSGTALIQPSVDSHTVFQIQDAAGTSLFNADTIDMTISISGTVSDFATVSLNDTHLNSSQAIPPTVGTPLNCGIGATAVVTAGSTDTAGSVTVTAGTGAPTTCDTTLTFAQSYGSAPKSVTLTPTTSVGSAINMTAAGVSNVTQNSFTLLIAPADAAAGTVYSYYYLVIQ